MRRVPKKQEEEAGIAPAVAAPQLASQHNGCVNKPPLCLQTVCEDEALRELVANWQRLTLCVWATIRDLAGRG
jgi:hypothetical protein